MKEKQETLPLPKLNRTPPDGPDQTGLFREEREEKKQKTMPFKILRLSSLFKSYHSQRFNSTRSIVNINP